MPEEIYHHQRCESGSTGYSFPEHETVQTDNFVLPRSYQRQFKNRVETQEELPAVDQNKTKKRVQFRNVATEPDVQTHETSSIAAGDDDDEDLQSSSQAGGVSRQDTMVEHTSVVVNEEVNENEEAVDYLQAIDSVKFDQSALKSGIGNIGQQNGSSEQGVNNFMQTAVYSQEEEEMIEKTLLEIRDRIRKGQPLSHQIAFNNSTPDQDNNNNNSTSELAVVECGDSQQTDRGNNVNNEISIYENQTLPYNESNYENQYCDEQDATAGEDLSENIQSSGMANIRRLSNIPIGVQVVEAKQQLQDGGSSSGTGLVMSSKPSRKNNNLSKKEIFSIQPRIAHNSVMYQDYKNDGSRKVSPGGGILKPSKNRSIESVEFDLNKVRKGFVQPPLPTSRRPEARIHQSATYSPVSHGVTRETTNIFEKKKLRMEKIQKLRASSNQSEGDIVQSKDDQAKEKQIFIQNSKEQQKMLPQSMPQTPKDSFLSNMATRLKQISSGVNEPHSTKTYENDLQENQQQVHHHNEMKRKKNVYSIAPPVTGQNSNAQNSVQKVNKGCMRSRMNVQNVVDQGRLRTDSSENCQDNLKVKSKTNNLLVKDAPANSNMMVVNLYPNLSQSNNASSFEFKVGQKQQTKNQSSKQQQAASKQQTQPTVVNQRLFTEATQSSLLESTSYGYNKMLSQQYSSVGKTSSKQSITGKNNNTAAHSKLGGSKVLKRAQFSTERSAQDFLDVQAAAAAAGIIDPEILRKLKALNMQQNERSSNQQQQQQFFVQQIKKEAATHQTGSFKGPTAKHHSIISNATTQQQTGTADITTVQALKQKESSSLKKTRNRVASGGGNGKQAPSSKSMAHQGTKQLISNFMAQNKQLPNSSLLQKEQIIFLLEHLNHSSNNNNNANYESSSNKTSISKAGCVTSNNLRSGKAANSQIKQSKHQFINASKSVRQPNINHNNNMERAHQRCESGSTGYSFPEPIPAIQGGQQRKGNKAMLTETQSSLFKQQTSTAAATVLIKKRVQFRNVATEPDVIDHSPHYPQYQNQHCQESTTSLVENGGSSENNEEDAVSREDTMVEHSVAINEDISNVGEGPADYMQALASAQMDQDVAHKKSSEELAITNVEEENFIEKTLLQIRDRIRSGLPLSFQKANQNNNVYDDDSNEQNCSQDNNVYVSQNEYSPDGKSENVESSGKENFRMSNNPIGAVAARVVVDTQESCSLGAMALSSKASHKNNNLSKKQIFSMKPKQAQSLWCQQNFDSRKASPGGGILKPPKKFERKQSIESVEFSLNNNAQVMRNKFIQQKQQNNGQQQLSLQNVARQRQEARANQSATYSPVSHCVTRDPTNIFEKKKLRMEKIQRLRGISNQSGSTTGNNSNGSHQLLLCSSAANLNCKLSSIEKDKLNENNTSSIEMQKQLEGGAKQKASKQIKQHLGVFSYIESSKKKSSVSKGRKHPASQPLTPRKFNIENVLQKLVSKENQQERANHINNDKKKQANTKNQNQGQQKHHLSMGAAYNHKKGVLNSKAPPVTGSNSNAKNSGQKVKRQPQTNNFIQQVRQARKSTTVSAEKKRTNSNNNKQPQQLQSNMINFYVNPHSQQQKQAVSVAADQQKTCEDQEAVKDYIIQEISKNQKRDRQTTRSDSQNNNLMSNQQLLSLVKFSNSNGSNNMRSNQQQQNCKGNSGPSSKSMRGQQQTTSGKPQRQATTSTSQSNATTRVQQQSNAALRAKQHQPSINHQAFKKNQAKKQNYLQSNTSAQDLFKAVMKQQQSQAGQYQKLQLHQDGTNQSLPQKTNNQITLNLHQQKISMANHQSSNMMMEQIVGLGSGNTRPAKQSSSRRQQNQTCVQNLNEINNLLAANFMTANNRSPSLGAVVLPTNHNFIKAHKNQQNFATDNNHMQNYKTANQ